VYSTNASKRQPPPRKASTPRISWDARVAKLLRKAHNLAATVSQSGFPIQLRHLAKACQVTDVIFKPMLVDGGLGISEQGFTVYVNTKEEQCIPIHNLYQTERLGRTLPVRHRFTIAHELAHTLFYDVTPSSEPKLLPIAARKANLDKLEVACNRIAAALLLPDKFLLHEKERLDIYNPNHLRLLARRSAVSDRTLSIRLESALGQGAIFCCEKRSEEWLISSVHPKKAFSDAVCSTPFCVQFPNTGLLVDGGGATKVQYEWRPQTAGRLVVPIELKCESATEEAQTRIFITLRPNGVPSYK
jgi:hypothetical protein